MGHKCALRRGDDLGRHHDCDSSVEKPSFSINARTRIRTRHDDSPLLDDARLGFSSMARTSCGNQVGGKRRSCTTARSGAIKNRRGETVPDDEELRGRLQRLRYGLRRPARWRSIVGRLHASWVYEARVCRFFRDFLFLKNLVTPRPRGSFGRISTRRVERPACRGGAGARTNVACACSSVAFFSDHSVEDAQCEWPRRSAIGIQRYFRSTKIYTSVSIRQAVTGGHGSSTPRGGTFQHRASAPCAADGVAEQDGIRAAQLLETRARTPWASATL